MKLDPAVMYRSLRDMERDGLISSQWMRSEAGPKRRVYDITAVGAVELERIAGLIKSNRDAQTAFLAALRESDKAWPP